MAGADPNPLVTHLADDDLHVTREEFERVIADLRADLRAELVAAIAALPGMQGAGKPTK